MGSLALQVRNFKGTEVRFNTLMADVYICENLEGENGI